MDDCYGSLDDLTGFAGPLESISWNGLWLSTRFNSDEAIDSSLKLVVSFNLKVSGTIFNLALGSNSRIRFVVEWIRVSSNAIQLQSHGERALG